MKPHYRMEKGKWVKFENRTRYFNVPCINQTFPAYNGAEARKITALGGVEIPKFVYEYLKTLYNNGRKMPNKEKDNEQNN